MLNVELQRLQDITSTDIKRFCNVFSTWIYISQCWSNIHNIAYQRSVDPTFTCCMGISLFPCENIKEESI